eukprot:gnl/MRDRNA2_/MRDRNA2_87711_c0_seq1.p1 gnl/MRDRNA2_/MRDRNA2_87711_c0~~gnl/MRDRNA2_/MRDRNA2_87711_c0_seq1.p1  ORF type:complete len:560 (+),score=181.40 gnl/MRDRNA2_/MRDRNA2_87711_c0_seq1:88-1767(+)
MLDNEENPFQLPPDDEIFLMRERERNQRAEDREKTKKLRVWEKTTACSRIHRMRRFADDDLGGPPPAVTMTKSASTGSLPRDHRREKENITDFVHKKREMFLVQMRLDVKKAEILKLDEKTKMKEDALKKSQAMLDEDVTRFDTFLQANDAKAHKAMKQAEDMTKKKQEKMQRIKQLKSAISAIQSEISKHKEQKEECLKYKVFLENLTPNEWKVQKAAEKVERKKMRRANWIQRRLDDINLKMEQEIQAEERAVEEREAETRGRKRRNKREEEEYQREKEREAEKRRRHIRRKYPTQEQVEQEYEEVSSGEEMPLYFREPKQLLEIFTALEEQNLFLIQNSQETEQALEEVEQRFAETQRVMGGKAEKMAAQIAHIEKQVGDEKSRCTELRNTVFQKKGDSEQEQLLKELTESVLEVHGACGYDADHDPNAMQMLYEIEKKVEEYLTQLDEFEAKDPNALQDLEKNKEKERRERVKSRRKEVQEKKTEERLKASLLRSQAPVHKKVGKQIMQRSAPLHMVKKVIKVDDSYEKAKEDFHIFGIHFQHGAPDANVPEPSF